MIDINIAQTIIIHIKGYRRWVFTVLVIVVGFFVVVVVVGFLEANAEDEAKVDVDVDVDVVDVATDAEVELVRLEDLPLFFSMTVSLLDMLLLISLLLFGSSAFIVGCGFALCFQLKTGDPPPPDICQKTPFFFHSPFLSPRTKLPTGTGKRKQKLTKNE